MKIGLFVFPTPSTAAPATIARKAEALGFESFWLPEHPIVPVHSHTQNPAREDGQMPDHFATIPDPFISLAGAAAVTEQLKLGTSICLAAQRHPLLLAKEVATLDQQSRGRMILGIGTGWLKEEAEILGVKFSQRWLHLRESVQAMRELWTKDEAEFHGQRIEFPPVWCLPHPVQQPFPPVLLGTYAYDEKSLRRVAQWADGWCPPAYSPHLLKETLPTLHAMTKDAGRDPAQLDITVIMGVTLESPCADLIQQYEEAGAQRVVLALGHQAETPQQAVTNPVFYLPGEAEAILERLAERSVERVD